jgi:hypothetical protein
MKVWVADDLGQIKSCSIDFRQSGADPSQSVTESASGSEAHDRSDYVQIMAHANWKASDKSRVSIDPLSVFFLFLVASSETNSKAIKSGVAIARRGGSLQVLDPDTGEILWNRRDTRVEPDDMFVALQETNGQLFWCTNHGYYGFAPLNEQNSSTDSDITIPPEDLVNQVNFRT